nr:hypothetical protein [uncultured Dysosmobacter sp.]
MPGLNIEEKKVVTIRDSLDNEIKPGTTILIRKQGEDILCSFKALEGGYFKTETMDGAHQNKYRVASIESCKTVEAFTIKKQWPQGPENKEGES